MDTAASESHVATIADWVGQRIQQDGLADDVGLLVLGALEGDEALDEVLESQPQTSSPPAAGDAFDSDAPDAVGAFLKRLTVSGFRGIGQEVTLTFQPGPGLTIIAGRNGCGKSSLSEAIELTLTGDTYRWKSKSKSWRERWRNIHHPGKSAITVQLAEEGAGVTTVATSWASEASLDDETTTVQRQGQKQQAGRTPLGWAQALDLYRPILSYDELGGLLDAEPSKLYDALASVLGLVQITDAIRRLDTRHKALSAPGTRLAAAKRDLTVTLNASQDQRVEEALRLIKPNTPDVAALRRMAVGTERRSDGLNATLSSLSRLALPTQTEMKAAVAALKASVQRMAEVADVSAAAADLTADLLVRALRAHDDLGDMTCPVCLSGHLDGLWAAGAKPRLAEAQSSLGALQDARASLQRTRREARALATPAPTFLDVPVPGLEDATTTARERWLKLAAAPAEDLDLADHLASTWPAAVEAVEALREAARIALQAREDAWAPIATRLAAYADEWASWIDQRPRADELKAALKWLKENDARLKNERIQPIADAAKDIWAKLRQESNVEISGLALEGANTRRHVQIKTVVDGADAGSLAVMSQGELHALSLALFLPRATMAQSPFRFLILDDPVQAMDPAKVDGLVTVLAEIAKSRQVIVMSHDDRLAEAVRRANPAHARILEVTRSTNSSVQIVSALDPARRYIRDARALTKDDKLPDTTLRRALPGILRMAVEAAARDAYFGRELGSGEALTHVESAWQSAGTTSQRVRLAVHGDTDTTLDGWLKPQYPHRKTGLGITTSAAHNGLTGPPANAVEAVERLVDDLKAGRR